MSLIENISRFKDELYDVVFITKRMILNPLFMVLHSLWICITAQEEKWIARNKQLAEMDRNVAPDQKPNPFVQGTAITFETVPPSLMIRSAMRLQFWKFYWNLERHRLNLSRTIPTELCQVGKEIPQNLNLIPVRCNGFNLLERFEKNIPTVNLTNLIRRGRHLVLNFGSCT